VKKYIHLTYDRFEIVSKKKLTNCMKNLFALILVLALLSVGCLFQTIGAFAMTSVDNSIHE
jgi:hypothetical protein